MAVPMEVSGTRGVLWLLASLLELGDSICRDVLTVLSTCCCILFFEITFSNELSEELKVLWGKFGISDSVPVFLLF